MASGGTGAIAGIGNAYSQSQALRGQQIYANGMTDVNSGWNRFGQGQILMNGSLAGSRARAQYQNLASTQRAAMAANGVNVNSGSAAQVQSETRTLGEIERLQIQQVALNQALGLKAENLAAVGQNRMRQIATRNNINQGYSAAASNAGRSLVQAAYLYDRYRGLGGVSDSALNQTLGYQVAPGQQYDGTLRRGISGDYSDMGNRSISQGR
jgi:hypothetical protein